MRVSKPTPAQHDFVTHDLGWLASVGSTSAALFAKQQLNPNHLKQNDAGQEFVTCAWPMKRTELGQRSLGFYGT
jgi:hypothetical protein